MSDLVERVARAIEQSMENARLFPAGKSPYEPEARTAIAIALEEAARVAELAPYNRGGMVCGCSEGLSNWTAAAIRAMIKEGG
jgi:hypothetical protein